jgi:hypothetical protein
LGKIIVDRAESALQRHIPYLMRVVIVHQRHQAIWRLINPHLGRWRFLPASLRPLLRRRLFGWRHLIIANLVWLQLGGDGFDHRFSLA